MRSRVLPFASDLRSGSALPTPVDGEERDPDLVLAFLPADGATETRLEVLAERWPTSYRMGCETVGQLTGEDAAPEGSLQLFWFDRPTTRWWSHLLRPSGNGTSPFDGIDSLAPRVLRSDLILLLADGLEFPVEEFLDRLNDRFDASILPVVAGGCASQALPAEGPGSRVFRGLELGRGACLVLGLEGVRAEVDIVRGWEPASPIYTVTRGDGRRLEEIEGTPALDWYRRFLGADGEVVPIQECSWSFPLMLDGPAPERRGLYRNVRGLDETGGALELSGDVRTGDRIRLGMGTGESLVGAADEIDPGFEPEAALLFTSVGRLSVLSDAGRRELEAVREHLSGLAPAGFHGFGEIGPTPGGRLALYNQTAVLTMLAEREEEPNG